jgi:hypothetical protein
MSDSAAAMAARVNASDRDQSGCQFGTQYGFETVEVMEDRTAPVLEVKLVTSHGIQQVAKRVVHVFGDAERLSGNSGDLAQKPRAFPFDVARIVSTDIVGRLSKTLDLRINPVHEPRLGGSAQPLNLGSPSFRTDMLSQAGAARFLLAAGERAAPEEAGLRRNSAKQPQHSSLRSFAEHPPPQGPARGRAGDLHKEAPHIPSDRAPQPPIAAFQPCRYRHKPRGASVSGETGAPQ